MDSFKTLIEKQQYDLVIELTKGADNPEDLLYRISAFIGKNEPKKAEEVLLKNREKLFAFKPVLTMKTSFELRFSLEEWDEAYEDIKFYENQPYVSQEVEEQLRALPKFVRDNERSRSKSYRYDPDEMASILEGDSNLDILSAFSYLSKHPIDEYIPSLLRILEGDKPNIIKTYALLLFVSNHYDKEVKFKKNGEEFSLIPSKLNQPYDVNYLSVRQGFNKASNDISLVKVAISLLDQYILEIYPNRIMDEEVAHFIPAFLSQASKYLQSDFPIDEECDKIYLDKIEAVLSSIEEI